MTSKLKYQEFLSDCDLNSYVSQKREGYRWVFYPINDDRNFIPLYAKSDYNRKRDLCIGYALSMYDEADSAVKRFDELKDGKPNFYKKIGTHLSKGTLEEIHGRSNTCDANGHFSLFEFEDVDLKETFEIIQQLDYDKY